MWLTRNCPSGVLAKNIDPYEANLNVVAMSDDSPLRGCRFQGRIETKVTPGDYYVLVAGFDRTQVGPVTLTYALSPE
jgi:predicted S18 family serine protease